MGQAVDGRRGLATSITIDVSRSSINQGTSYLDATPHLLVRRLAAVSAPLVSM